jgi:integrase
VPSSRALNPNRPRSSSAWSGEGENGKPRESLLLADLRFHDLRHEATSRLFDRGLHQIQAAAVTGHKDVRMLMRYTHAQAELLAKKLG